MADRSHTPHRLQTTLNAGQEELVVYLRSQLRLPLDDLLAVVRECIHPTMGRSSLHRITKFISSRNSRLRVRLVTSSNPVVARLICFI